MVKPTLCVPANFVFSKISTPDILFALHTMTLENSFSTISLECEFALSGFQVQTKSLRYKVIFSVAHHLESDASMTRKLTFILIKLLFGLF